MIVRTGKSRLAYHGVAGCDPERTPSWLHMAPGRLNFTFRNTGLGTEAQLLLCYNAFFASFGLLCFVAWLLLGLTLAEWLAATAPFFYFLPFGFQVSWLHGMSSQGTYAALLSDAAAADSALVSPLAPGAPERSAGGGGAAGRR